MKTISLIISTFLITVCVYAQTPEKILARVAIPILIKKIHLLRKVQLAQKTCFYLLVKMLLYLPV